MIESDREHNDNLKFKSLLKERYQENAQIYQDDKKSLSVKNAKNISKKLQMNFKKLWKALLLAQSLSFIICGTGIVTSTLSDEYQINIPTAQSVLNYAILALIFIPSWVLYINDKSKILKIVKEDFWKYLILALVDVEANYLIIKAYSLTIMTSIQVIDAFILPMTLVLSYFFLRKAFKINHVMGVVGCLFGCAFIILADFSIKDAKNLKYHKLEGDFLCLLSSALYAVSNVGSEWLIKARTKREYLAMIGFFGTLISIVQMLVLERSEISNLFALNKIYVWILFLVEAILMFAIYILIPCVIDLSSAAFLNVNLLTSDFYAAFYGIFVKKYQFHYLYFIGFGCILLGTILYCLSEPNDRMSKINKKKTGSQNDDIECNATVVNDNEKEVTF
ncbi:unnamed protein product [Brachionus calyciflorus]|uniref:Solute carrier family 35 member F2 n=1 Tax=Brachionus calyciflorus TaxID=104777 RepID=A0A814B441_9BILA|nr:unnamed protein product [Brachionus calyciflorus]